MPKIRPKLKIALVHDFLTQLGGAERVLEGFHRIWPSAPVYTSVYDQHTTRGAFRKMKIRTSFVQHLPRAKTHYKWYLALYPWAMKKLKLDRYDVVLSDTASLAKGIHTRGIHICYLHTPTRYLTADYHSYLSSAPIPFWIRPWLPLVMYWLKHWDYRCAQAVDYYIANSENVAKRLKKYYHREADLVIFPPVEAQRFQIAKKRPKEKFFLLVSRIEPYKKVDLAVRAFNKLGLRLKVVGSGTQLEEIRKLGKSNIEFLGWQSDEAVAQLYSRCEAMIFPQDEDAGITPLECMASGRPVIAYRKGGALETVVPGLSGEFFSRQTVASLVETIHKFENKKYNPKQIRAHALKFDLKIFQKKVLKFVTDKAQSAKSSPKS